MTGAFVIAEIHLRLEPQMGHAGTSTENTRAKSSDDVYFEHGREALPEPRRSPAGPGLRESSWSRSRLRVR